MATQQQQPTYTLGADEKAVKVMVYTTTSLYWGEVVVKELIRVNTWLRTNAAPDRITLYNAHGIVTTSPTNAKPCMYPELNIAVPQIIAFHIMPPGKEPVDYDPSEPNRRMEPVSALLSTFQVKGFLRLSTNADLKRYLEVTRETFTALYDAEITNQVVPNLGPINTAYILVRQETTSFAKR